MQKNWKSFVATQGNRVFCSITKSDLTGLTQCSHKDANTPLLPHTGFGVKVKLQYLAIPRKDSDLNPLINSLFQYHIFTGFDTVFAISEAFML